MAKKKKRPDQIILDEICDQHRRMIWVSEHGRGMIQQPCLLGAVHALCTVLLKVGIPVARKKHTISSLKRLAESERAFYGKEPTFLLSIIKDLQS